MEYTDIGEKLRKIRQESGYTQKDVALELEMAPGTLLAYEKGIRSPNWKTINKLMQFYEEKETPLCTDTLRAEGQALDDAADMALSSTIDAMLYAATRSGKFELSHKGRKYLTIIETVTENMAHISVSLHDGRFRKDRFMAVSTLKEKSARQIIAIIYELKRRVFQAYKGHIEQAESGHVVQIVKAGEYAELRFPASDAAPIRVPPQNVPALAEHYQGLGFVIYFSGFGGIDGIEFEKSQS